MFHDIETTAECTRCVQKTKQQRTGTTKQEKH